MIGYDGSSLLQDAYICYMVHDGVMCYITAYLFFNVYLHIIYFLCNKVLIVARARYVMMPISVYKRV